MRPFQIDVPAAQLADLHRRLDETRWPADLPGDDWARGIPSGYLRQLADYWRNGYDWRRIEARLNARPQFVEEIDGVEVHFLHVRSAEPGATPLLLTHGWPGSPIEFLDVIDPLVDPVAHGGSPADAFHVVVPSLPGYGFSQAPREPGWNLVRIAAAWAQLMARLGYDRYVPQGGDLGAWVTLTLAGVDAEHVAAAHVNFLVTAPSGDPAELAELTGDDVARLQQLSAFAGDGSGYMKMHATRPQTLAYPLVDSPVGLLAWMVEKYHEWTGAIHTPEEKLSRDQMLDNVTLYWLTATAGSAANMYYEMADLLPTAAQPAPPPPPLPTPLGVAVFPEDSARPIRSIAERRFPGIVHWREYAAGGHFAAMEQPATFVADLRQFARTALSVAGSV